MSSGGLVSGLSGLSKSTTFHWFGWPGIEVPEGEMDYLNEKLKDEYNAVPVYLSDDMADKHYNGFSSTSGVQSSHWKMPHMLIIVAQIPFYGHCSIITLVRFSLTKLLGRPIRTPTEYLRRLWRPG